MGAQPRREVGIRREEPGIHHPPSQRRQVATHEVPRRDAHPRQGVHGGGRQIHLRRRAERERRRGLLSQLLRGSRGKTKEDKWKIKVTVVDPYTVKMKWTKPYFMADEFSLGLPLLPKHIYSVDAKGEPISNDISSEEFAKGFN